MMNLNSAADSIYRLLRLFFCLFASLTMAARTCKGQELPIKAARTISFETTEGTYMDMDISPDGKILIFDLLGDLYTLPLAGGTAVQLTRGMAYNRYPVWSPDGKQIAFISDVSGANHLNVMNADGSERRVLGSSEAPIDFGELQIEGMPAWTPDNNYVAVDGYLYHLAGGRMLLPLQIRAAAQFSSDGHFLYYEDDESDAKNMNQYNRHSGKKTKLADLPNKHANPRISPDSQWLAYVARTDTESGLRLHNLITGEDRLLVPSIEGYGRNFCEHYAFVADSRSILIGFGGKLHRIEIQSGADHIIPFTANVNIDCGPFNYNTYKLTFDSLNVKYTRSANASADGKNLVFTALSRLYIMSIPSGTPHILTEQSLVQCQPIFSPDGKWIAYVTWSDKDGGKVWRVRTTGGKPEPLSHELGYYCNPAWSPDGKKIAIMKDSLRATGVRHRFGNLTLLNLEDGSVKQLAEAIPITNSLTFSADGARINFVPVYKGSRPGATTYPVLTSLDLNGSNIDLLAVTGPQTEELVPTKATNGARKGLKQVCISPDNRYLVYEISEDLYIVPTARVGTPSVLNDLSGTFPVIRFAKGGADPHWENNGKVLSWSYGNQYYRIDPDKIIGACLQVTKSKSNQVKNSVHGDGFFDIKVTPDETVNMRITMPKSYAHGTIALRNVRIISMKGNEVIEHGTIVISDGRFSAIGITQSVHIPQDAKIMDLKGKTIMPGLIDLHDHVNNEPRNIFSQQWWEYLANLAYGVTTARDPSSNFDSFGYGELLQVGQMTGPRLFTVGEPVTEDWVIKNLDDAREVVRKRTMLGAVTIKQYQQPTRQQKQWLLIASREARINMTNEGDIGPQGKIAMIKDGSTGVEHAYEWGNVYSDVIQFIAQSGTWHTPTLQVANGGDGFFWDNYYKNLYLQHPDKKLSNFWAHDDLLWPIRPMPAMTEKVFNEANHTSTVEAAIRHAAGHVTVGSHGNNEGIGAHWETWLLQSGGLTNMEALQAATIEGAKGLGMQEDLGSIEVGKLADLVVLDKNPLEDIHNTLSIKYVMKDGILYDGNTLDELWPAKKKLPEWQYTPAKTNNLNIKK